MQTLYAKTIAGGVEFYRNANGTAKTLVKKCATPYPSYASKLLIRHNGVLFRLKWLQKDCADCGKPTNASLLSGNGLCVPCVGKWIKNRVR